MAHLQHEAARERIYSTLQCGIGQEQKWHGPGRHRPPLLFAIYP